MRPTARFCGPVGILPHKRPTGTTCRPKPTPCRIRSANRRISHESSPLSHLPHPCVVVSQCDSLHRYRTCVCVCVCVCVCYSPFTHHRESEKVVSPTRVTLRYLFLGTGAILIEKWQSIKYVQPQSSNRRI